MLDYLLDAMNEISDEHITEAVNFKAKAKKINFKKLIPMAACLVFVVAALLTGSGVFGNKPEPSSDPIFNSDSPTMVPTQAPTQAHVQGTTGSHGVPVAPDWEELSFGERFLNITVSGVKYVYAFDRTPEKRIGEHIASETVKREYLYNDWHTATAEMYEIRGVAPETYIAVSFAEDESGEYLIYVCPDFEPQTLGELLDAISIDNINFIGETVNYHLDYPNGDFYKAGYKIDPKAHKELSGMLWKNRAALRCEDDFHSDKPIYVDATMTTSFAFIGEQSIRIYISKADDKTHLCFAYSSATGKQFCFELEDSTFDDYLSFLENEAEVLYTRHGCPTAPMLTTPTTDGTTLPPTNENFGEVEKVLGTAETLGDIMEGFHIAKADYGISGDMTVDLFARLEEKGKQDVIYSIAADTKQQLIDFMYDNKNSKAENRSCRADVRLVFSIYISGNSGTASVCDDGYLYLDCGGITKAFYVGEDAYRDFKENLICAVWTTENPVTMG